MMWAAGFSLDNLVADGGDDFRRLRGRRRHRDDREHSPQHREGRRAHPCGALIGTRQIGFTVVSISLSLIAAFIPLLFMSGIPGRMFREFSLTLTFAIIVSAFVSLTITPMICGHFMPAHDDERASLFRPHRRRRAGSNT